MFRCALVGEEALPRDQMKARIRDFLYAQLDQAQQATSVKIAIYGPIHDLYHPSSAVK